jgi:hypothetical protein
VLGRWRCDGDPRYPSTLQVPGRYRDSFGFLLLCNLELQLGATWSMVIDIVVLVSTDRDYVYQDELAGKEPGPSDGAPPPPQQLQQRPAFLVQYALLEFESPVLCPLRGLIIGSRLDSDIRANACRIAFYGTLVTVLRNEDLPRLRIYKEKAKEVGSQPLYAAPSHSASSFASTARRLYAAPSHLEGTISIVLCNRDDSRL